MASGKQEGAGLRTDRSKVASGKQEDGSFGWQTKISTHSPMADSNRGKNADEVVLVSIFLQRYNYQYVLSR